MPPPLLTQFGISVFYARRNATQWIGSQTRSPCGPRRGAQESPWALRASVLFTRHTVRMLVTPRTSVCWMELTDKRSTSADRARGKTNCDVGGVSGDPVLRRHGALSVAECLGIRFREAQSDEISDNHCAPLLETSCERRTAVFPCVILNKLQTVSHKLIIFTQSA